MPRAKTHLSPSEYAVLGLLRRKPAYGYELQPLLRGSNGLGRVNPVEPAMVYAILKSLSGLELIEGAWDYSEYPGKAIYRITDEGEATFERWLSHPVSRMREVRLDFLIKLYFLLQDDKIRARDLITVQIAACADYVREVEKGLEGLEPASFDYMALTSKLSAAKLTRNWLLDCRKNLDADLAAVAEVAAGGRA
jgi:PadR family transcriptional regulator, regulatory protein AphA